MKETLKRIKADIIVSALLCIALGIVLLASAHCFWYGRLRRSMYSVKSLPLD